jgi:hypothetical protein
MHYPIQKKRLCKISKIILLHDDAHVHTENLTKATLAITGWEIMNCPPYCPDLPPNDIHLFVPVKVNLQGQKSQTDYEHVYSVLNWLCNQDKSLYVTGISILQGQWKKCVSVNTEHHEKG